MHVMIATDGSLDAPRAAALAINLAGADGSVTVLSVVEVPRAMLDDMRRAASSASQVKVADIDVAVEYRKSQAADPTASGWIGDDAVVARFVKTTVERRTADLVSELEGSGVDHRVVGVEGENAARSVLAEVRAREPDVLFIGTHGLGRFEGLLGSNSTKLSRHAPCSVLLVR